MSKTNHQRGFKAEKFARPGYDYVCGKRGQRRNTAGMKKFFHSRHRASEDLVVRSLLTMPEDIDFSEVNQRVKYPSDYIFIKR
jgi:hypothetical protein